MLPSSIDCITFCLALDVGFVCNTFLILSRFGVVLYNCFKRLGLISQKIQLSLSVKPFSQPLYNLFIIASSGNLSLSNTNLPLLAFIVAIDYNISMNKLQENLSEYFILNWNKFAVRYDTGSLEKINLYDKKDGKLRAKLIRAKDFPLPEVIEIGGIVQLISRKDNFRLVVAIKQEGKHNIYLYRGDKLVWTSDREVFKISVRGIGVS